MRSTARRSRPSSSGGEAACPARRVQSRAVRVCGGRAGNTSTARRKRKRSSPRPAIPNGFEVEFWAARERPIMEAIVNQLRQAGIKATLRYVKGPTLSKAIKDNQVVIYYGSSGSFSVPDAGAVMGDKFTPRFGRELHRQSRGRQAGRGRAQQLRSEGAARQFPQGDASDRRPGVLGAGLPLQRGVPALEGRRTSTRRRTACSGSS